MLAENLPHVPASQLGYYAGIVESVYALVQFTTIFFWGRLSDSIGRKPVLLTGLCGTAISVTAFGLAPSFPAMIVARSIAGLMNGNIAVLKSVMGEITDHTNQARAFSLIPICFALGSIVGSTLGGNLAHPAENLPAWFGGWSVLKRFPFLLPCLLASSLNVTAVLLGWLFLKETLPSKTRREEQRPLLQDQDEDEDHSTHPEPETQTQTEAEVGVEVKPSVRSLMTPAITQVLVSKRSSLFARAVLTLTSPDCADHPILPQPPERKPRRLAPPVLLRARFGRRAGLLTARDWAADGHQRCRHDPDAAVLLSAPRAAHGRAPASVQERDAIHALCVRLSPTRTRARALPPAQQGVAHSRSGTRHRDEGHVQHEHRVLLSAGEQLGANTELTGQAERRVTDVCVLEQVRRTRSGDELVCVQHEQTCIRWSVCLARHLSGTSCYTFSVRPRPKTYRILTIRFAGCRCRSRLGCSPCESRLLPTLPGEEPSSRPTRTREIELLLCHGTVNAL